MLDITAEELAESLGQPMPKKQMPAEQMPAEQVPAEQVPAELQESLDEIKLITEECLTDLEDTGYIEKALQDVLEILEELASDAPASAHVQEDDLAGEKPTLTEGKSQIAGILEDMDNFGQ